MEYINDYLTDEDIYKLVERDNLSYQEIVDLIEDKWNVKFTTSTVGNHYRDFRDSLNETEKIINDFIDEAEEMEEESEDYRDFSSRYTDGFSEVSKEPEEKGVLYKVFSKLFDTIIKGILWIKRNSE